MSRIPDELIDSVVYLYPSEDEARRGATQEQPGEGGTGFLISYPVEDAPEPNLCMTYVVTNSHVVGPEGRSMVLRLNKQGGGTDVIPTTDANWYHHPDGDGVAVCPIAISAAQYKFRQLQWNGSAMTPDQLETWRVGPGDEVFYLGRFRLQEGMRRNLPTVRSGTISRMPLDEGVKHPRGFEQESFIVEARSISGYSGSPVFVYIPPFAWRGDLANVSIDSRARIALIGIDWGHQPDFVSVLGPDKKTPDPQKLWVKENSGLMMVVPSWRIDEFLRDDDRLIALEGWRKSHGETMVLDISQP